MNRTTSQRKLGDDDVKFWKKKRALKTRARGGDLNRFKYKLIGEKKRPKKSWQAPNEVRIGNKTPAGGGPGWETDSAFNGRGLRPGGWVRAVWSTSKTHPAKNTWKKSCDRQGAGKKLPGDGKQA